jgi:hypothetical protein
VMWWGPLGCLALEEGIFLSPPLQKFHLGGERASPHLQNPLFKNTELHSQRPQLKRQQHHKYHVIFLTCKLSPPFPPFPPFPLLSKLSTAPLPDLSIHPNAFPFGLFNYPAIAKLSLVHESETDIPFLRPNHLHIFSFAPCLASRGSNGTGPGPRAVYQSWDTGSDRSK